MPENNSAQYKFVICWFNIVANTGVNPAEDAGDTSPQYFGWGDVNGNIPQYYYVLSDIKVKFSHTRYRALGPELIPV